PKMALGPVGGGAVRLAPITEDGKVAVAEGIETALSYTQLTGRPCWSGVAAVGIEHLILPDAVRFVCIAVDNDEPGKLAATKAARRWHHEGREVWFDAPPSEFNDFNDALQARGVA